MEHVSPTVVALNGDLNVYRRLEVQALLQPLYEAGESVLDLSDVRYFDSTFLTALAVIHKHRVREGRPPVRLVVTSPLLQRVLDTMGFDKVFLLFDSLNAALSTL
jgi:anti-anti-sigma factor